MFEWYLGDPRNVSGLRVLFAAEGWYKSILEEVLQRYSKEEVTIVVYSSYGASGVVIMVVRIRHRGGGKRVWVIQYG